MFEPSTQLFFQGERRTQLPVSPSVCSFPWRPRKTIPHTRTFLHLFSTRAECRGREKSLGWWEEFGFSLWFSDDSLMLNSHSDLQFYARCFYPLERPAGRIFVSESYKTHLVRHPSSTILALSVLFLPSSYRLCFFFFFVWPPDCDTVGFCQSKHRQAGDDHRNHWWVLLCFLTDQHLHGMTFCEAFFSFVAFAFQN